MPYPAIEANVLGEILRRSSKNHVRGIYIKTKYEFR